MAPSINFPVGYKFHPRDEELVEYYLYNKVRGAPFRDEHVILEIDLYGSMEARDIWNNNGRQNLEKDEDLYFFTKLKPAIANGTGSRIAHTIGSGTWKGENSGTKVEDPNIGKMIGFLKRFQYMNIVWPEISLKKAPGLSTQLPQELALWLVVGLLLVERLQEEDIVSSERCLCRAVGVGIEARNQN